MVADHRPLAEQAGFTVLRYDETENWSERCRVFADYLYEHADDVAAEAGAPVEDAYEGIADLRDSIDCMSRRFLLVAERRSG
jgi:hypothetical protein